MSPSPTWYDVLGVSESATSDEIRTSWRAGIAELEPGSPRFRSLNQAAEVLLDPQRRSDYDAELGARQAQAPAPDDAPAAGGEAAEAPAATSGSVGRLSDGVPAWALAVLALLAVGSLALAWFASQRESTAGEEAARAAQQAAERAIVPVLSYDYRDLEGSKKSAQAFLTGEYRQDYDQLFAVISDNAPGTQTTVEAEVIASGIVRSGTDRVDVLIFVDRPTTNKASAEPVVYKDQVTVTMENVDGTWLVDNLTTSPAQS